MENKEIKSRSGIFKAALLLIGIFLSVFASVSVQAQELSGMYPEAVKGLIFNGEEQQLTTAGTFEDADISFSFTENGEYSSEPLSARNAGNYTVYYRVIARESGELLDRGVLEAVIAKREITFEKLTIIDKKYNGSLNCGISGSFDFSNILPEDSTTDKVKFVSGGIKFEDKNVGYRKVNFLNFSLTGTSADNYVFVAPELYATISPKEITSGWPKEGHYTFTYNGLDQAPSPMGVDSEYCTGDDVRPAGLVEGPHKDVGVYQAGIMFAGADGGNYVPRVQSYHEFVIVPADFTPSVGIEGWAEGRQPNQPFVNGLPEEVKENVIYTYYVGETTDGEVLAGPPTAETPEGNYCVVASLEEHMNYHACSSEPAVFSIGPREPEPEPEEEEGSGASGGGMDEHRDVPIIIVLPAKDSDEAAVFEKDETIDVKKKDTVLLPLVEKMTRKTAVIKWNEITGAERYYVYVARYDSAKQRYRFKRYKVTGSEERSVVIKGLEPGQRYKFRICAKDENGKVICKSRILQAVTRGGKYINSCSISFREEEKSLTLKIGDIYEPKPVRRIMKRTLAEGMVVRYLTDRKGMLHILKDGSVEALREGTVRLYAVLGNGRYDDIEISIIRP